MATDFKKVRNNATARLLTEIGSEDAALTLKAGQGNAFPSEGDYWLTIFGSSVDAGHEIVLVTARDGDELTVTRGQQGTNGAAWPADSKVAMLLTAGSLEDIHDAVNGIETGETVLDALTVAGALSVDSLETSGTMTVGTNLSVVGLVSGALNVGNAVISGGTINGTPIGGTTPAAGAFTTLSASGNASLTITGGTINGAPIGGTNPSTGAFTGLSVNGGAGFGTGATGVVVAGTQLTAGSLVTTAASGAIFGPAHLTPHTDNVGTLAMGTHFWNATTNGSLHALWMDLTPIVTAFPITGFVLDLQMNHASDAVEVEIYSLSPSDFSVTHAYNGASTTRGSMTEISTPAYRYTVTGLNIANTNRPFTMLVKMTPASASGMKLFKVQLNGTGRTV